MVDMHYFLFTLAIIYIGVALLINWITLAHSTFDLKLMVILGYPLSFQHCLHAVKDCVLDMCVDEHFQSQTLLEHCAQLHS